MPPRKSNVSVVSNGDGDNSTIAVATPSTQPATKPRESLGVEDLNLPRTMIQRLAKGVLPPNTQIQKDAILAMSKSATVFVNFLAWSASENATAAGKKTIMPHDVFAALKEQEFEMLLPRVQAEVTKYNEIQSTKRNEYRRSKKAEQMAAAGEPGTADGDGMDITGMSDEIVANPLPNGFTGEEDAERPQKKVRREDGGDDETEDAIEIDDEEDPMDEADEEESEDEDVEVEDDEDEGEVEPEEDDPHGGGEEASQGFLNGIRDEALDEPDSD